MSNNRPSIVLAAALCCVLLLGSCSEERADPAPSADDPTPTELIISRAITRAGPSRSSLDSLEENKALLTTVLGLRGLTRPEIDCYLGKVIPAFGEEKFAGFTIHQIQQWAQVTVMDLSLAVREDSATCVTQAARDRRKAKEIAPDLDIAAARRSVRKALVAQAIGVDLTPSEAECYVAATVDGLTDEQFRAGMSGKLDPDAQDVEGAARTCVPPRRRRELREKLLAALDAQRQLDAAERKIVESRLNEEVNDQLATTTTR